MIILSIKGSGKVSTVTHLIKAHQLLFILAIPPKTFFKNKKN